MTESCVKDDKALMTSATDLWKRHVEQVEATLKSFRDGGPTAARRTHRHHQKHILRTISNRYLLGYFRFPFANFPEVNPGLVGNQKTNLWYLKSMFLLERSPLHVHRSNNFSTTAACTKQRNTCLLKPAFSDLHLFRISRRQQFSMSSEVAEMGDRLAFGHNRHGPKSGGCCAPFRGERWVTI